MSDYRPLAYRDFRASPIGSTRLSGERGFGCVVVMVGWAR
jgi:hypothetical protein